MATDMLVLGGSFDKVTTSSDSIQSWVKPIN
jgi:hypothetical protein